MTQERLPEHALDVGHENYRKVETPTDVAQPHPNAKEAMKIFANFQRQRENGLTIDIANLSRELRASTAHQQFPEALFVEWFLPLFAGEVDVNTWPVNYQTWLDKVAGGHNTIVDIVKEDGSVVFSIPPIFDTSILEHQKPGSETMTLIERHYSRLKEFDARGSQVYLERKLSSLHIKSEPTEQLYHNFRVWNAIFEHYGKKDKILNLGNLLENDPNKDKPITGVTSNASSSDLSDYELDTD